jgi:hypothetical protein
LVSDMEDHGIHHIVGIQCNSLIGLPAHPFHRPTFTVVCNTFVNYSNCRNITIEVWKQCAVFRTLCATKATTKVRASSSFLERSIKKSSHCPCSKRTTVPRVRKLCGSWDILVRCALIANYTLGVDARSCTMVDCKAECKTKLKPLPLIRT